MDEMAAPPFPSPDSAVLRVVVQNAINAVHDGSASVEEAILHAAVHGWYEGHIEGEDACPGCDYRGDLGKQHTRGWVDPDQNCPPPSAGVRRPGRRSRARAPGRADEPVDLRLANRRTGRR